MEELPDYCSCIAFIPPITAHKGLGHIPDRDIFHSNVNVVSVLIGGDEFDKPFVLLTGQRITK